MLSNGETNNKSEENVGLTIRNGRKFRNIYAEFLCIPKPCPNFQPCIYFRSSSLPKFASEMLTPAQKFQCYLIINLCLQLRQWKDDTFSRLKQLNGHSWLCVGLKVLFRRMVGARKERIPRSHGSN